jgi:hypothetical protein
MLTIFMGAVPAACSAEQNLPTDIKGHWAEDDISTMLGTGVVGGYPDGTFKPNRSITRAEFTTIVNRAFGTFDESAEAAFTDVKKSDWYYRQAASGKAAGFISGYPDGTFKPNTAITREQSAVILANLLQLNGEEGAVQFTDAAEVSAWAKQSVKAVSDARIVGGYPDGTFKPLQSITRAETVVIVQRALAFSPDITEPEPEKPAESSLEVSVTADGRAVDGATVNIFEEDKYEILKAGTTNSQGIYWLELEKGTYNITVVKDKQVGFADDVIVNDKGQASAEIKLVDGVEVQGKLLDKNSSSVKNTEITFTTNPTFVSKTDSDGQYKIALLPDKKYTVRAYNPDKKSDGLKIVATDVAVGGKDETIKTLTAPFTIARGGGGGGGSSSGGGPPVPSGYSSDGSTASVTNLKALDYALDQSGITIIDGQGNTIAGNVTVNKPGITLQNTTIKGNFTAGAGINDGDLTLENVIITGTSKFEGGGGDSIHLQGATKLEGQVTISKAGLRLVVIGDKATVIGKLVLTRPARIVSQHAAFPGGVEINIDTQVQDEQVTIAAPLETITVKAAPVTINIDKDITIKAITIEADDIKIDNQGTIEEIEVTEGNTATVTGNEPKETKGEGTVETPESVPVSAISVTTDKTEYKVGEELDLSSLVLTVEYNNNTSEVIEVTMEMVSGFDSSEPGTLEVTVTYKGKTATFTVNIVAEEPGDTTAPEFKGVTPAEGNVELAHDANFVLTVAASDENLYELEVDHSFEGTLPEFSVYASEDDPYGGQEAAFKAQGVEVTYDADAQKWTIDFGEAVTEKIVEEGGITFYLVIKDQAGNAWGSMDPTTPENTFAYTVTQDEAPEVSGSIERDPGNTGGDLQYNIENDTVTFTSGEIKWYPEDKDLGRAAGNRVGVQINAPADFDTTGVTVKIGEQTYNWDEIEDGDGYFWWYPLVTKAGETFTATVVWNESSTQEFKVVIGEGVTLEPAPDTTDPELVVVSPEAGDIQLGYGETFKLEVTASDENLYELEVDHSFEGTLPEFSVYASEDDPYGGQEAAFKAQGVEVTYDADAQKWTIDFGEAVTEKIVEEGGITFYLVIKDQAGNAWGSMDPTTPENTFAYTVTQDEAPEVSGSIERDPGNTGGDLQYNIENDTVTFTSGEIKWYPEDKDLGRAAGNRVGVQINAPADFDTTGVTVKIGEQTYNWDEIEDGDGYFWWYPLVTKAGETFTATVVWNESSTQEFKVVIGEGVTLEPAPDTTDPELVVVSPEAGDIQLGYGETFKLEVTASDENLYELEVDHSFEGTLPEFSVYASEDDPYGGQEAAFKAQGVEVTYDADAQKWTIDFGEAVTEKIVEEGGITFYLVIKDQAGNAWGSMDPTTPENTFAYTVTQDEAPEVSGSIERDPGNTGGDLQYNIENDTVTFTSGEIKWYPEDKDLGRAAGNRVGVQINAPADFDTTGVTVKIGEQTYNWDEIEDGDGYFWWYPLVTEAGQQFTATVVWNESSTQEFKVVIGEGVTLEPAPDTTDPELVVVSPEAGDIQLGYGETFKLEVTASDENLYELEVDHSFEGTLPEFSVYASESDPYGGQGSCFCRSRRNSNLQCRRSEVDHRLWSDRNTTDSSKRRHYLLPGACRRSG